MPSALGIGPAVCDGRLPAGEGKVADAAAAPSADCNGCASAVGDTADAAGPSNRLPSGCAATAADAAAAVALGGTELPCELPLKLTGGDCWISAMSGLSSGVAASPSAWCKSAESLPHMPSQSMQTVAHLHPVTHIPATMTSIRNSKTTLQESHSEMVTPDAAMLATGLWVALTTPSTGGAFSMPSPPGPAASSRPSPCEPAVGLSPAAEAELDDVGLHTVDTVSTHYMRHSRCCQIW
jgi:hypothetical protein